MQLTTKLANSASITTKIFSLRYLRYDCKKTQKLMLILNLLKNLFIRKKLLAWKCWNYVLFHLSVLCIKVLSPLTFFASIFIYTNSINSNSTFLDTHIKIFEKNVCGHISTFCYIKFKSNLHKTAQKIWKHIL